jgi:hypothetical protein
LKKEKQNKTNIVSATHQKKIKHNHQNCTKKTEEDGKEKKRKEKKLTSKETFQFCL